MRRGQLPLALVLAGLLGLLVAAPASAAVSGTLCGQVTAFTAPTAVTDGSITIDGATEVIDATAFGAIDAATLTVLTAVADADATTCLEISADPNGDIVDLSIAAQAEICGDVALDTTTGVYSVGGVALPLAVVNADAELVAMLDAAAAADAQVCLDVTISSTTGLITTIGLSATFNVCGDVTLDADSATIGGVDLPLTLLDAEAQAAIALAIDAGSDICVQLVIDDTALVQANVSLSIDLCGDVTLDASGNVMVDGVVIPDALLDANVAALLELAAAADGTACASVDATSTGGNTTVGVTVAIEVCAEVTAVTENTITLGGVTFFLAGAGNLDVEIGDTLCVTATTSPTGDPVITDVDTTDDEEPATATPGATPGGGSPMLPDTATAAGFDTGMAGALLLIATVLGAAGIAIRRWSVPRP